MEHNRLLNVWRDVVSVKRIFAEMKSATERDLSKLSSEISSTSREMTNACGGVVNAMQKSSRMEVCITFYFIFVTNIKSWVKVKH